MPSERSYSDAEMREILERALAQQGAGADSSGISHTELLAIGEQIGVPAEAMARAAAELTQAKLAAAAADASKARRRRWLAAHAAVFATINLSLFTVNFLTTPGEWWVLFSVFFWGLALAAHASVAALLGRSSSGDARERLSLEAKRPRLRVGASAAAVEPAREAAEPEAGAAASEEPGSAAGRVASRP